MLMLQYWLQYILCHFFLFDFPGALESKATSAKVTGLMALENHYVSFLMPLKEVWHDYVDLSFLYVKVILILKTIEKIWQALELPKYFILMFFLRTTLNFASLRCTCHEAESGHLGAQHFDVLALALAHLVVCYAGMAATSSLQRVAS